MAPEPAKPATNSEVGFSYELGVDIEITEGNWQSVRFAKAIAPNAEAKTQDGQTYDDLGADHPIKVGESWTLTLEIQHQRLTDGKYLPEVEAFKAATEPDALGNKAPVHVRWYDKPATGKANPDDAYEGFGTVSITRSQTGTNDIGGWNITVTGQGPRKKIKNPLNAAG